MVKPILVVTTIFLVVSASGEKSLEYPDIFPLRGNKVKHCEGNAVVAAWCDAFVDTDLDCAILPEFDEYGCTCIGNHASCPTECIGGVEPLVKTHSNIRCGGIPVDSPNYILKETHALNRCESNAAVSAWCDDFINKHLECHIIPEDNQYICKCSGKHTNCPDECIGGLDPIVKTATSVLCSGIPGDTPNYILKEK